MFPGVPRDGVEPLDAVDRAAPTSDGGSNGSHRLAFEAGDFWDNGDTQEFVGVAGSPSSTGTAVLPDTTSTPEPDVASSLLSPTEQDATQPLDFDRRLAYRGLHRRAAVLAPVLVAAAFAAGVVVLVVQPGSTHRVGPYAAAHAVEAPTTINRASPASRKTARLVTTHRPSRRPRSVRRHRTTAPKIVQARYTAPAALQYTESTPSSTGPSYQPRAVAASADSSSSSASAPAQAPGPTGAGALTGAGSTPSG